MLKSKINQRGDTIVEVLIAMAIIGLILVISFVTVNRSSNDEQSSQERSEAVQLLQNQIEDLRYMATNSLAGSLPGVGSAFCVSGTSTIIGPFSPFNSSTNLTTLTPPATNCTYSPNGSGTQPEYFFEIIVSHDINLPNNYYTFTAMAVWSALGGGVNTSSIAYRINTP